MGRQSEGEKNLISESLFLSVKKQDSDSRGLEGAAPHFLSLLIFSQLPAFFYLTEDILQFPRGRVAWQTRVISNHPVILSKQPHYGERKTHPILGHAPFISYFLPAGDGGHLC